jgi:hypothetical protein
MFSLNYKTLLVGSAAAALFAGCGSGDLSSNVISTECDYLFRCAGGSSQTAFDRLEYGTESGCVAAEQDGFDVADEYRQFIDAGTVVIDNGAADRCLRALRATCTNTLARQLACDRIFVGQVADGGGCVDDVQCASGQCDAEGFEQCGSCMALIPTGSPCEPFVQSNCAPGPNGEDGFCSGGRCALRELEPELTEDAAIGTDCDFDQLCEAGLYCQDGTCARWREHRRSVRSVSSDSCWPWRLLPAQSHELTRGRGVRASPSASRPVLARTAASSRPRWWSAIQRCRPVLHRRRGAGRLRALRRRLRRRRRVLRLPPPSASTGSTCRDGHLLSATPLVDGTACVGDGPVSRAAAASSRSRAAVRAPRVEPGIV